MNKDRNIDANIRSPLANKLRVTVRTVGFFEHPAGGKIIHAAGNGCSKRRGR